MLDRRSFIATTAFGTLSARALAVPLPRVAIVLNPGGQFKLVHRPMLQGLTLAAEETRAFDPLLLETPDSLDGQRQAAERTVESGARYVIGHNFSGLAEAYLRSLPKSLRIGYISPFATSPKLTELRNDAYLVWPGNAAQAAALAQLIRENVSKGSKLMSIVNISEPYAIDLADSLIAALNGSGIALDRVEYIKGSFDPTALVAKLDGSMAVFIPSYNYDLVTFLREVGKRFPGGKGPQVYTGDTTGSRDDFFMLLGAGVEVDLPPVYFTNGYADELMDREYAAFSAAYRKRFGIAPEGAAAVAGYEAGLAMAELVRLGPASPPGALVGRELLLPLGTTAFGKDHLLRRPVTVNKIRNSRFELLRLFRPDT